MSTHTPGPWRACRQGECTCGTVWSLPSDFPVCTARDRVAVVHKEMADAPDMVYATIPREEAQANARLIAAAPDMLEALRWYADQLCEHGQAFEGCGKLPADDCAGCPARAAIAKVEGRA